MPKLTKEDIAYFKTLGITDPVAHLHELIRYEDYVNTHYPQVSDEGWSFVTNEEEE